MQLFICTIPLSVAQREQVFKKTKEHIMQLAVDGAKLLKRLASETEGDFSFEYSPESFHGTEVDYAVDVCNAVLMYGGSRMPHTRQLSISRQLLRLQCRIFLQHRSNM